jgi:glycosyltransferase involved in cell wall biosynthesis
MSQTPLISVVMPVYNHEKYVVNAIRSVFEQDLRPLELIMIDDGSTDTSVKTINDYLAAQPLPEGVTVSFHSRPNRGAHNTINEGLAQARGEYLAILNSDDLFLPGRLSRCVSAAQTQRARMVFTYVDPIDDNGEPLSHDHRWRSWYADVKMEELDIAPSLSSLLLRYNIAVSTGNLVFHRSVLDDVGYFDDFRYAHDIDYVLRFCLLEEPVILREKLYGYRVHTSNTIAESTERITREYAEIVRRYLSKALVGPVTNPFAPTFKTWSYSLIARPWPQHLEMAVDQLMAAPESLLPAGVGDNAANLHLSASQGVATGRKQAQTRSHITLVSHELSYSGAPVLLRDIAMSLHDHGASTNVISLVGGPLAKEFEALGSTVTPGSRLANGLMRAGSYFYSLSLDSRVPGAVRRLLNIGSRLSSKGGAALRLLTLSRRRHGTLLINSFASWPIALQLLRRWKGPAYWYIHETYEPGLVMRNERSHRRLRRLVQQGTITLLFGSEATRSVWANEGLDGKVLYWSGMSSSDPQKAGQAGVDSGSTSDKPAKARRVILSVQSTGTRKGTWPLIEAFALGRRNGWIPDDVELRIIGCPLPSKNPFTRDLLCRVSEPDVLGAVSLVSGLPPSALDAHYRDADVYVQSSIMECLPLALLSAMAHGLPIVSTDADGCREAILDGLTGRLVAQRQIEDMARALSELLSDTNKAKALGAAARARFEEKFSLEVTVPPLIEEIAPELLRSGPAK